MISVENCALSDQRIRLLTGSAVIVVVVVVLVPTLHEKKKSVYTRNQYLFAIQNIYLTLRDIPQFFFQIIVNIYLLFSRSFVCGNLRCFRRRR